MREDKTILLQPPSGANDLLDEVVNDDFDARRREMRWILRRYLADHEYGSVFMLRLDEETPWGELARGLGIKPDSLRKAYDRHRDEAVRHCHAWLASRRKGSRSPAA